MFWPSCNTLSEYAFPFFPSLIINLTPIAATFYTKHEVGLRVAYWFGFGAVAGTFGGLIAYGVQQAHTAIENWRLLFIIEVRS